jgi:hypothetical protein
LLITGRIVRKNKLSPVFFSLFIHLNIHVHGGPELSTDIVSVTVFVGPSITQKLALFLFSPTSAIHLSINHAIIPIPIRKSIDGGLQQNGIQKGRPPKDHVTNPYMQTRVNEGQTKQFIVKALAGQYDKKRQIQPAERATVLTNRLDACFFPNGESIVRVTL